MAALAYTQATSKRKITCRAWDEVDKILEKKLLGYRSQAEFVAEAVRGQAIASQGITFQGFKIRLTRFWRRTR